jgi:hypothetical protein
MRYASWRNCTSLASTSLPLPFSLPLGRGRGEGERGVDDDDDEWEWEEVSTFCFSTSRCLNDGVKSMDTMVCCGAYVD